MLLLTNCDIPIQAKVEAVVNIHTLMEAVIVAPTHPAPGIIAVSEISFGVDRFTENTILIKVCMSVFEFQIIPCYKVVLQYLIVC